MMGNAKPKVDPNVITFSTLMDKAQTLKEIEQAIEAWQAYKIVPVQVFSGLTKGLAKSKTGAELLNLCFTAATKFKVKFPTTALQSAMVVYLSNGKVDDFLRIAVAFPHLPGAVKGMRQVPQDAAVFFKKHFSEEPHHASYAMAKLFQATGDRVLMLHWAKVALAQKKQPPSRTKDIQNMLDEKPT
jgi:hypothetical protein